MKIFSNNLPSEIISINQNQIARPCSRITTLFLKTIASLAIGAAIGAGIGFSIGFIAAGAVLGGIVGLVALAILTKACTKRTSSAKPQESTNAFPVTLEPRQVPQKPVPNNSPSASPNEPLPIEVGNLHLLKEQFNPSSTVVKAIDSASRVLSQRKIQLAQSHDNHTLHHNITIITDEIRKRADLKKPWKAFLHSQNGRPLIYPDGYRAALDFSRQISRLEHRTSDIQVQKMNPLSPNFEQDIDEMITLRRECFGAWGEFTKEQLMKHIRNNGCFIARDNQQKLVGFLWYLKGFNKKEPNLIDIAELGRSANACKMGIGEKILEAFLEEQSSQLSDLQLYVRVSNEPAISLYEKFGFTITEKVPYYKYPSENRYTMHMDWSKYKQRHIA